MVLIDDNMFCEDGRIKQSQVNTDASAWPTYATAGYFCSIIV